jgi:hypothetical protein
LVTADAGDVTVRLGKARLTRPFDGTAHVNLSEHPHDARWTPVAFGHLKVTSP